MSEDTTVLAATASPSDHDDDGHKESFTIGELSREFDVTLRTLRFYEDRGLLTPERHGLTRYYTRRDRARLKLVLMGKRVGFSLTEIKDLLDLYDLRDGQVTQLRAALDKFEVLIGHLKRQKADIQQAIDELGHAVEIVTGMLEEKDAQSR